MVMDVDTIEQILELAETNPKRLAAMYINLSYDYIELDNKNEAIGKALEKETGKHFLIHKYSTEECGKIEQN